MEQSILIIQGHPDPSKDRFCNAIACAYAAGAKASGHKTTILPVADIEFPLLRKHADFYGEDAAAPATLLPAIDALKDADHLVIIYPLWMGGMPAYTRAFFEQTFRPGVAMIDVPGSFPKKNFSGKTARIIVTMGMPGFAFRWIYGAFSVRGVIRSILKFSGISPVKTTYFGLVDSKKPGHHERFLKKVAKLGEKAA